MRNPVVALRQAVHSYFIYVIDILLAFPDDPTQKPTVGLFEDEFYIHPDQTSAVLQDTGVLRYIYIYVYVYRCMK